jgi:alpha-beta hydrolase superfamily lysophospholipase
MEPFYFGPEGRALLGAYHPPASRADRDTGVVLCNPFGREYLYSHRALRHLAQRLSEQGFHVLRFDYSSTGDSDGACEAGDARQWVRDTILAIAEIQERAGLDKVCLIGLRLGALVALHAASGRRDVDGLVLWEPLSSARAYLADLETAHHNLAASRELPIAEPSPDGATESAGFLVSRGLQDSLLALDEAASALRKPARRALVLRQDAVSDALAADLAGLGVKSEETVKTAPRTWLGRGADGRVVVPGDLLQTIVDWVKQGVR